MTAPGAASISSGIGRQDWLAPVLIGGTGLGGLALFLAPLRGVRAGAVNGLGLISVLPVASLCGLAVLVLAFAAMLALRRPVPLLLSALLVAIVFGLDGVTAIVEPLPRFPTTYQIYGFVNYIRHTGHVAPGVTAYFSWPGFFALVAFAARGAGVHGLLPLLRWWPVLIDTLVLVPFMLFTRGLRITWRARWLAALLLCAGNWVGQDYFSPQSLAFLLYLAFIAIVVTWFGRRAGGRPAGRADADAAAAPSRTPGEQPARQAGAPARAVLLAMLIAIFAAATVSHQLTPLVMLAACAGLALVGRCSPRGLPVLLAVLLIGWVSFETAAYWSGHLAQVFGQVGRLGGIFSASFGNRLTGTPVHEVAVYARVALAGLMLALAALGLLRRWLGRIADRALVVLLVAPATMAALQSYGGEISLRIYLFALPATAVLAATLFFPGTGPGRPAGPQPGAAAGPQPGAAAGSRPAAAAGLRRGVAAGLAGLAAVTAAGLFVLARYGNEAFEQIPPGELAAMNYIYAHQRGGTSVVWASRPTGSVATPELPWAYRDVASVGFASIRAPANPAEVAGVVSYLRRQGRGAYLITARTEAAYLRQSASYPPDWEGRFRRALAAAPGVRLVMANRSAAVYQAVRPVGSKRAGSHVHRAGPRTRSTGWTRVGLIALAIALVALTAREFVRECLPGRRRLMRPLAIVAAPAVALLLIAVAIRFRTLA